MCSIGILWPLANDVVIGIRLNQTSRGSPSSRAYMCDEEAAIWFGDNLICNKREERSVGSPEPRL